MDYGTWALMFQRSLLIHFQVTRMKGDNRFSETSVITCGNEGD
jgi:hypothetical protein